jgi:hypothetical protein
MMNALKLPLTACAIALALAACADMDWTKAGADKAMVSRDLDDCRGNALRNAPPPGAVASQDPQMVDRGSAPNTGRPAGSSNERFIAEHEAVRQCMVSRGYKLTPAQ